jgi:hypothetical protein
VTELAAPGTVNTMPETTLLAFADHGRLAGTLEPDDWAGTEVDVDLIRLSERLQKEGAESFNRSWAELLDTVAQVEGGGVNWAVESDVDVRPVSSRPAVTRVPRRRAGGARAVRAT